MNNISKYAIGLVTLLIVILSFYYLGDIIAYIIVAWVLSMLGTPMVTFLRKFMKKGMAAGLTIISIMLGASIILWLIVPPVIQQVNHLSKIDYSMVMKNVEEPINDWNNWLKAKGLRVNTEANIDSNQNNDLASSNHKSKTKIVYDTLFQNGIIDSSKQAITIVLQIEEEDTAPVIVNKTIDDGPEILIKAKDHLVELFSPKKIPGYLGSVFGFAGTIMVFLLAVIFLGFFFLKEQGLFGRLITMWVPSKHNKKVYRAIDETSRLLERYFLGVALQVTIITIYVTLLLKIFGIENALMIGFLVGLINVIPFIGPMIGWVFSIVIILSSSMDLSFYQEILPKIGILTGVIASMQLMDNLVLQPNIFSRSVKAHPVEIFLVILIAAKVGGILGMVLAIPTYTVFRVIAKEFLGRFEVLSKIAKGLS